MNQVILIGRLVRDPDIRNSNNTQVARYTLAVDRRFKREGDPDADFINCIAFGKAAEFCGKYFRKGTKIAIRGHIQTSNYTNRDGQKVYTTDVVVEEQEFAESKGSSSGNSQQSSAPNPQNASAPVSNDFMSIPDGNLDDELPFH